MTQKLADAEIARLFQATRQTLFEWTDRLRGEAGDRFPEKVTAFRPGMAVHGRYRLPCPVCATKLQRIVYAENETNYCPRCQTGGRLLADRALSRLLRQDWPRTIEEMEQRRTQPVGAGSPGPVGLRGPDTPSFQRLYSATMSAVDHQSVGAGSPGPRRPNSPMTGPTQHRRKRLRLRVYDYSSPGAYFITTVCHDRQLLLEADATRSLVADVWESVPVRFPSVALDAFVIMPNHIHGILLLNEVSGDGAAPQLGQVVGFFKYGVTKAINDQRGTPGAAIWQRNYYEHVIRNEAELEKVREYLLGNPGRWEEDEENPQRRPRNV